MMTLFKEMIVSKTDKNSFDPTLINYSLREKMVTEWF